MLGAENDDYRFVIDETSFDFRGLPTGRLTELIDDFSDTLDDIRQDHVVAKSELWYAHPCLDVCELGDFLWTHGSAGDDVSPDARRRLLTLMDRCPSWERQEDFEIPDVVRLRDTTRELAWTLGHAVLRTASGRSTGCVVFPADHTLQGWVQATAGSATAELFFLRSPDDLVSFWRGIYDREEVPESSFAVIAAEAFPHLVLAESLSFGRFIGSYRETAPWVVRTLSVLNDHFADAMHRHAGIPHQVQAELGRFKLDLSPESPKTRANPKIMRQREVEHEREKYLCEWHAKQHPARNRIHFSVPDQRLGGRILVGIFVDHLDT